MSIPQMYGKKISMFDFTKEHTFVDIANRTSDPKTTVSDLAAVIFEGDLDEDLPDEVTICVTVFADLGFVVGSSRTFPTWAFMNETGSLNLSLSLGFWPYLQKGWWEGNEKMWLDMQTGDASSDPIYGKLLPAW